MKAHRVVTIEEDEAAGVLVVHLDRRERRRLRRVEVDDPEKDGTLVFLTNHLASRLHHIYALSEASRGGGPPPGCTDAELGETLDIALSMGGSLAMKSVRYGFDVKETLGVPRPDRSRARTNGRPGRRSAGPHPPPASALAS